MPTALSPLTLVRSVLFLLLALTGTRASELREIRGRVVDERGHPVPEWSLEEIRRYYLFHLLLHEVGHINQPLLHDARRREEFAENFALEWAAKLNELPKA